MMCHACEEGRHADCGMQTWCECDCDPDAMLYEVDTCDYCDAWSDDSHRETCPRFVPAGRCEP